MTIPQSGSPSFAHSLQQLMQDFRISNVTLARLSGCDASTISRYRSGRRQPPRPGSSSAAQLIRGLCLAIRETKPDAVPPGQATLAARIRSAPDIPDTLQEEMALEVGLCRHASWCGIPPVAFSGRLNSIMEILQLNNAGLAHRLHIDPSLISRYRRGHRIPRPDSLIVGQLSRWLAQTALRYSSREQRAAIRQLIELPDDNTPDEAERCIFRWLLEACSVSGSGSVDRLLRRLNGYSHTNQSLPAGKLRQLSAIDADELGRPQTATGVAGLQNLLLLLLNRMLLLTKPGMLCIYSDQPSDWLTADPFAAKWIVLLRMILAQKHRIQIIHATEQSHHDMVDVIMRWLPLCLTGRVESYIHPGVRDSRFCRTMFVVAGEAAVHAAFVAGTQNQARYQYAVAAADARYLMEQFNALLATCLPFGRALPVLDASIIRKDTCFALRNGLPIEAMPFERLRGMLQDTYPVAEMRQTVQTRWAQSRRQWLSNLRTPVTEMMPLPDLERLKMRTLPVPFPVLNRMYQHDDFCAHLKATIDILEKTPAYRLILLPETPFHHLAVVLRRPHTVILLHDDSAGRAFQLQHSAVNDGISLWLEDLAGRVPPACREPDQVISTLKQLLRQCEEKG